MTTTDGFRDDEPGKVIAFPSTVLSEPRSPASRSTTLN